MIGIGMPISQSRIPRMDGRSFCSLVLIVINVGTKTEFRLPKRTSSLEGTTGKLR